MDWFQLGYTVLGGLGIFFFGMKMLSDGLQSVGSLLIRRIINSLTTNRFIAVAVGLTITMIVQSSSITTVMVVGFVNAGLMSLTQAIGVIFGANIGTTITGWIIAIKIGKYSLLLLGLAILPLLQNRSERLSQWGRVVFGLGLVFLGLQTMSGAFKPLRTDPDFIELMTLFTADSYLSLLGTVAVGCALTFIIQSSSAMLGITIALASTGSITFQTAAALVMGENIGTTVTAILAGLAGNSNARRAALAHAMFNVLGVVVLTSIFHGYVQFIDGIINGAADFIDESGNKPFIAAHIAASHTVFNIANVVLFLPFVKHLAQMITRIYPDQGKEGKHLEFLGKGALMSTSMALSQGKLELEKMGQMVVDMLGWTKDYFESPKRPLRRRILKYEVITDSIHQEMMLFAHQIMQHGLSSEESQSLRRQVKLSDELESIADYCQKLVQHFYRLQEENLVLDDQTSDEIKGLIESIVEFANKTIAAYKGEDQLSVSYIKETKRCFDQSANDLKDEYLLRVEKSKSPALANLTIADIVHALSRIFSHTKNLAEWQIGVKVASVSD